MNTEYFSALPVSNSIKKRKVKILFVGGPDIDKRIDLMLSLKNTYHMSAAGSMPSLQTPFRNVGFEYYHYSLSRRFNPVADIKSVWELYFLFRKVQPQIVHSFDTKENVLGRIAAYLAGVPIIIGSVTGLGSLYTDSEIFTQIVRTIYEKLQRWACLLSDMTIFYNQDDYSYYTNKMFLHPEKKSLIPGSGIKADLFNPTIYSPKVRSDIRHELNVPMHSILVTMIARVIRSKGILEYLEAAEIIQRSGRDVSFLLVGELDIESIDCLSSQELDRLKRTVIWAGARTDIPEILYATDIFVLPSYREGIPRVLLEAAAMEVAIISTDIPGSSDFIQNGENGILVPIKRSDAIIEAINILMINPNLRYTFGKAAREKILKSCDLSVVANDLHTIYNNLIANINGEKNHGK